MEVLYQEISASAKCFGEKNSFIHKALFLGQKRAFFVYF